MGGDDGLPNRRDGVNAPGQTTGPTNKREARSIMHLLTTVTYTRSGFLRDSLQVLVVMVVQVD